MKNHFRLIVILVMCFCCVACQSTPRAKVMREMTDGGNRPVYQSGPITPPKEDHRIAKKTFMIIGGIILVMPFAIVMGLAASGQQIHAGK